MIARRYAGALYEQAEHSSEVEAVDDDMNLIKESLVGAPELVRFFASPVISREKKSSSVKALFESRIQKLTLNFLLLMVEKGREELFPEVVRAYQSLRDSQMGVVQVTARVAKSFDEEEKEALLATLEARLGKKARLVIQVDPSLLGGIVVKIGDTVYDGSFVNQLKSLRSRLEEGIYTAE